MLIRLGTLAFLTLVLASWSPMNDSTLLYVQSAERSQKTFGSEMQERADKEMNIGRYYLSKHDYSGALHRFRIVVTQYPYAMSTDPEEALAHLVEIFLALGFPSEAQTAVAVLDRRFPNGRWSIQAHSALESAGLVPAENKNSWMAAPFN
jgi:outer membrane protein assembly factor BamD